MLTPTEIALDKFQKYVVSQSKRNLTVKNKNVTKALYNSIKGDVKQSPNSIQILFTMLEYGFFQDQGVKGVKSGRSLSGFKYTNKMPPAKAFDQWNIKRGLAPRDAKGKFLSRKSLNFAMARHVYNYGIKPTEFFSKPFDAAFKNLPQEVVETYGLEAERLFDQIVMQNLKKK
jgi:hypothetical protein